MSTPIISCYHCGEAVPESEKAVVVVRGIAKPVCCIGCQAVATLVLDAGLDRFYEYRNQTSGKPIDNEQLHALSSQWQQYDDTDILSEISREQNDGSKEAIFVIDGIYCTACTWLIEHIVKKQSGVIDVQVNPITGRIRLRWNQATVKLSVLLSDIAKLGYSVQFINAQQLATSWQLERRRALNRLLVAGIAMMQVMMYAVAMYIGAFQDMDETMRDFFRLISFIITTPVVLYSAQSFFINAYRDLKSKRLGMDVPVALAIGGAYLASITMTVTQNADVYYDSVVMFTFLLLLGRYAESALRQRIRDKTDALSRLLPLSVTRLLLNADKQTSTESILLSRVNTGDIILVKSGDIIPADGIIEKGAADINESLLTGESKAVRKRKNDKVMGGSININGELQICVQATGQDTLLSQISYLTQRAQAENTRLVKLADQIAAWFVFSILLLAVMVGWYWWLHAPDKLFEIMLAVLIVSCPCALSLATPVALAVASTRYLKSGFLVIHADAIETLSRVSSVVFDKTGTLTKGVLSLVETQCYGDTNEKECVKLATALEQGSRHPVATAFATKSNQGRLYEVENLEYVAGAGIKGLINNKLYRIGTKEFALNTEDTEDSNALIAHEIKTHVYLADKAGLLCQFTLMDSLRDDAVTTLAALSHLGLKNYIASGDSDYAVQTVLSGLSLNTITETHSRMKPEDKLQFIKALQAQGEVVLMIGDGVNDAPVLAAADISIAMNSGTALAQSASSIILLGEKLSPLQDAVQLAKRTRGIIKQNLLWALLYNATAIPLAASGLIEPWMAAIGMSLSSLLVLVNALRLSGYESKPFNYKSATKEIIGVESVAV